ncbi:MULTISPECIES: helix-turn-helix domain-containing protein [Cytobacillus]|uniref:helix-turn-helix domain-containing protein n=1 Tax=Cytobacillus TaxID=2675230 RepID=UPI00203FAF0F|nr:helix-turn-helix domain-containing protein [Cytobacillus oceanisediminis]MCM3243776.1 helix-turn-helix domain-containing protein [Cytobacillus oceanisediminis]MCS0825561.1 helix-turn-helix domain-containing protein [Cytobacillus firmus]USK47244.1 helix-turn-helix domain-containing protein [Cytobacillus oceanisediminis]
MSMADKSNEIGQLLKSLLKERSLSMRKFSQMTGVDTAVISKIINGKRKATPEHLERFADYFGVSISRFYESAGYPIDPKQTELNESIGYIQAVLESTSLVDKEFRLEAVKQELEKYQQFSQTKEGAKTIQSKFEEKVEKVGSIGPFIHYLKDMYGKFSMGSGNKLELAMMGGALLYFITAVDCIPDYVFPVGYIDDALVINWVMNGLSLKK